MHRAHIKTLSAQTDIHIRAELTRDDAGSALLKATSMTASCRIDETMNAPAAATD
jgi:hypothetical protein